MWAYVLCVHMCVYNVCSKMGEIIGRKTFTTLQYNNINQTVVLKTKVYDFDVCAGRGSPRTSQSPFTGSPDPLLLSPHSMSPNSAMRQQAPQVI